MQKSFNDILEGASTHSADAAQRAFSLALFSHDAQLLNNLCWVLKTQLRVITEAQEKTKQWIQISTVLFLFLSSRRIKTNFIKPRMTRIEEVNETLK